VGDFLYHQTSKLRVYIYIYICIYVCVFRKMKNLRRIYKVGWIYDIIRTTTLTREILLGDCFEWLVLTKHHIIIRCRRPVKFQEN
jgi:hypothetical protein